MWVCVGVCRWGQMPMEARGIRSRELELQAAMLCWIWTQGNKLGSSSRAVCALKYRAIPPVPGPWFDIPVPWLFLLGSTKAPKSNNDKREPSLTEQGELYNKSPARLQTPPEQNAVFGLGAVTSDPASIYKELSSSNFDHLISFIPFHNWHNLLNCLFICKIGQWH